MKDPGKCGIVRTLLAVLLIAVTLMTPAFSVAAASYVTNVAITYDTSKVAVSTKFTGAEVTAQLRIALASEAGAQARVDESYSDLVRKSGTEYHSLSSSNEKLSSSGEYYFRINVEEANGYSWNTSQLPSATVNGKAADDIGWYSPTTEGSIYVYKKVTVTNNDAVFSVDVTPSSQKIQKGTSYQFSAEVAGSVKTVNWSLYGQSSGGTKVSSNGTVTVAANETASSFTVRASSTFKPSVYGEATVEVTAAPVQIERVTIDPHTAFVHRGSGYQFYCTVVGTDEHDVVWSVRNNNKSSTSINSYGYLYVDPEETAGKIYVDVTSVRDPSKSDTATVYVLAPQYVTDVSVCYDIDAFTLTAGMTGAEATDAFRSALISDAGPQAAADGNNSYLVKKVSGVYERVSSAKVNTTDEYYLRINLEEKSGYYWDTEHLPAVTVNGQPAEYADWYSPTMTGSVNAYKRVYVEGTNPGMLTASVVGDQLLWKPFPDASWYNEGIFDGENWHGGAVSGDWTSYDLFVQCAMYEISKGIWPVQLTALDANGTEISDTWTGFYKYDPDSSERAVVIFDLMEGNAFPDVRYTAYLTTTKGTRFYDTYETEWQIFPDNADGIVFDWWYYDEARTQQLRYADPVVGNMTLYAKWLTAIDTVRISAPNPVPGTKESDYDYSAVRFLNDDHYELDDLVWTLSDGTTFEGTFQEDETYYLHCSLIAEENYGFAFNFEHQNLMFSCEVNGRNVSYNSESGEPAYAMFSVPVAAGKAPEEIILDAEYLRIVMGKSDTLTATVLPEDAVDKEIEWASYNAAIASVDSNGKVTGVRPGYTRIRATSKAVHSVTDVCDVLIMFKDVAKPSAFYFDPVYWALDRGITSGYTNSHGEPNGKFGPDDSCTRAQIVTFLWRAAGAPVRDPGGLSFTDVKPTDYFYNAVIWAAQEGITTGYTDKYGNPTGVFGSNDTCTRAQIVTFLWRADGSTAVEPEGVPTFTDVKETDYFYKAVLWAAKIGITTGYTDSHGNPTGKFGSNDGCTRGQVVTFLYRASRLY